MNSRPHHHHPGRAGPGRGGRGRGSLVGLVAGAVVRGVVAGAIISTTRRRPNHVHHRYAARVVVVSGAGTPKRVIELVCPTGVAPGQIIEVTFEGHQFYATVPQNVAPGATFRIEVELPAPVAAATLVRPVAPPPPPLPAAIVSDRHGEWHRAAYPGGVASAERPWRGLGVTHASVMFVRDGATWTVAKSYGLPNAIAAIEKRFHEEFVHELFPLPVASTPDVHAVSAPSAPPPPPLLASHPPAVAVSDANPF